MVSRTVWSWHAGSDCSSCAVVEGVLKDSPDEVFFTTRATKGVWLVPATGGAVDLNTLMPATGVPWSRTAPGIGRHGLAVVAVPTLFDPGSPEPQTLEGFPNPPKEGTPCVLWEIRGSDVYFVTSDGVRWSVGVRQDPWEPTFTPPFRRGLPPVGAWPQVLAPAALSPLAAKRLRSAGGVDEAALGELDAATSAWRSCALNVLAKAGPERTEADRVRELPPALRAVVGRELNERWRARVGEACFKHLAAYEAAYLTILDGRARELEALSHRVQKAHAKRASPSP
jgi:hypothetical protein